MKEKNRNRELQDELQQIAPQLHALKEEDGFTVPHNYFREIPDTVMARIANEGRRASPDWNWLQLLRKPQYAIALTCAAVLIIAVVWLVQAPRTQDPLAALSTDEALEYVLKNLQEFNSDELVSAGLLTEWDATEVHPVSEEEIREILEDEELLDELMMN